MVLWHNEVMKAFQGIEVSVGLGVLQVANEFEVCKLQTTVRQTELEMS